ncbi:TPA: hypothetical protein DCQ85_04535 [Candidatus Magasanikbacteria bacterium]|nr:MAG: hypothetical protein A2507_04920 [Candidatus Magasanikbacteria bacterium RIFOXYD12_FULL_33_17]HAO52703.1 hypothetical protein [Candidatus Magasanikbacteria bacterium]
MFYLKAFLNSCYNFAWLRMQSDSGKKAANYIVLFILGLSLVTATFLSYTTPQKLVDLRDSILTQVPEFSATMENNHLTISDLAQPYVFEDENLIIRIDTTASSTDFNFDEFVNAKDKDILYFTSTSLYSYDGAGHYKNLVSYNDIPNKTFDKEFIINSTDDFLHNTKLFFGLFLLMSFVGFSVFKLLNLLLISLIVFLINKNSQSDKLSFGQIYTLGLFALTGPSVIVAILRIFNYSVSFLYSILLLVILVLVTSQKVVMTKIEDDKDKILEASLEN